MINICEKGRFLKKEISFLCFSNFFLILTPNWYKMINFTLVIINFYIKTMWLLLTLNQRKMLSWKKNRNLLIFQILFWNKILCCVYFLSTTFYLKIRMNHPRNSFILSQSFLITQKKQKCNMTKCFLFRFSFPFKENQAFQKNHNSMSTEKKRFLMWKINNL